MKKMMEAEFQVIGGNDRKILKIQRRKVWLKKLEFLHVVATAQD